MIVFAVVAIFAVVQSLFGVGLLVFGTPTLLLLGYPFAETLAILLPASLAVSFLQLWSGSEIDRGFVAQFAIWCLIPLAAVLALVIALQLQTSLNLVVALALATFVMLRASPRLSDKARLWVSGHRRAWLLLMGLVHGFSNLGGGLLTILAASQFRDKERIRSLIALCYSCFATIQLGILAALSPGVFSWWQLAFAATSAIVYLGIGRKFFRSISVPAFDRLFTVLMASYAAMLGLRVIGVL